MQFMFAILYNAIERNYNIYNARAKNGGTSPRSEMVKTNKRCYI